MPKSTGTATTIADASTTCEPQTSTRSSSTGSARTPSTTDSDSTTHNNMDENNTDNNNEDNTGQTTPRPDLEDTLRGLRGATPKDEHSRELYQAINELDRDRRLRKSKRLAAKRQQKQTSAATERKGPKSGSMAVPIRSVPVESPATKEKKASRTTEHNK